MKGFVVSDAHEDECAVCRQCGHRGELPAYEGCGLDGAILDFLRHLVRFRLQNISDDSAGE